MTTFESKTRAKTSCLALSISLALVGAAGGCIYGAYASAHDGDELSPSAAMYALGALGLLLLLARQLLVDRPETLLRQRCALGRGERLRLLRRDARAQRLPQSHTLQLQLFGAARRERCLCAAAAPNSRRSRATIEA